MHINESYGMRMQFDVFHNEWKLRSNKQIDLFRKCHQYKATVNITIKIETNSFMRIKYKMASSRYNNEKSYSNIWMLYYDEGKDAMVNGWDNDAKKCSNICICCIKINSADLYVLRKMYASSLPVTAGTNAI